MGELLKKNESEVNGADSPMNEDGKNSATSNDDDDDDDQEIKLEELLDGLVMDDGPDEEDANPDELEEFGVEEGEKAAADGIHYVGREESRFVKDKEGAVPQSSFAAEYKA